MLPLSPSADNHRSPPRQGRERVGVVHELENYFPGIIVPLLIYSINWEVSAAARRGGASICGTGSGPYVCLNKDYVPLELLISISIIDMHDDTSLSHSIVITRSFPVSRGVWWLWQVGATMIWQWPGQDRTCNVWHVIWVI